MKDAPNDQFVSLQSRKAEREATALHPQQRVSSRSHYRSFNELAEAQLGAWERVGSDANVCEKVSIFWRRLARAALDAKFDDAAHEVIIFRESEIVLNAKWFAQFAPQKMTARDEEYLGQCLGEARASIETMAFWAQDFGYLIPDVWIRPNLPPSETTKKTHTDKEALQRKRIEEFALKYPRGQHEQKTSWYSRLREKLGEDERPPSDTWIRKTINALEA